MPNPLTRLNDVSITLVPNNYYIQLPSSVDRSLLAKTEIEPFQIAEVQIFKSYRTHTTDVKVWIESLDPTIAGLWSEGKYIALLSISPAALGDTVNGISNYFVCLDLTVTGNDVYGTLPTVKCIVTLKSITRTRLELENNFPFELGGRGEGGAAGAGMNPIDFKDQKLAPLYQRTYSEEGETDSPWTEDLCNYTDKKHLTDGSPSNGYKMEVDNNFEALELFFEHYPLFNTVYDWVLDDFNTMDGNNPTTIRITDFTWWEAWLNFENVDLSNLMNNEVPEPDNGGAHVSQDTRTASALKFFNMQKIEQIPYYDAVTFSVVNGFPKIWATDISSGNHIPTPNWNALHVDAPVLTPGGNIRIVKNPMYKEFLTFMQEQELSQTQLYKNLFQSMHPVLETYTFSNLYIGEIDLHTVVKRKKEKLQTNLYDYYGYDRLGAGYQLLHTYSRHPLEPRSKTLSNPEADGDPRTSQYSYKFILKTEIVFLFVDARPLEIAEAGHEEASFISDNPDYYNYLGTDPCASSADYSGGGTDGKGIPGNTSIADQGQHMVDHGFKYCYGGTADDCMDCSGFTQKAVKRAGITNYPRTTHTQVNWLKNNAARIDKVENIKRGDIVFFKTTSAEVGHTGIAISNTQFIHSSGGSKNTRRNPGKGASTSSFASYYKKPNYIFRLKQAGGK